MRVLVAYDGSDSATLGCRLVGACPWPDGSEIKLVTASHTFMPGTMWPVGIVDPATAQSIFDGDRESAQSTAAEGSGLIGSPGARVTTEVVEGRTASAILEVAASFEPDLLVVGTRGQGPFRSTFLGSVSAELIDHAACAVLVARGPSIERVLLAYDGSAAARCASALLASSPMFRNTKVTVATIAGLHERRFVEPDISEARGLAVPPDVHDVLVQAAQDLASEAVAQLQSAGIASDVHVRADHAAQGIVRAATETRADLIVMGRSGHGLLERLLLGSVARSVLHHAHCSVMVVHPPRQPVT